MLLDLELQKEKIEEANMSYEAIRKVLAPLDLEITKLRAENKALYGTIESMKQTNAALIKKCQKLTKSNGGDYSNMKAENFEYKQKINNPHRYLPEEEGVGGQPLWVDDTGYFDNKAGDE